MSRFLLSAVSSTSFHLLLKTSRCGMGSKPCPPPYPQSPCESINEPIVTTVCSTVASEVNRKDDEFDKCLAANIANPTPPCTLKVIEAFPCERQPWPKNRNVQYDFKGESAWENVACCNEICASEAERHDVLYLKPKKKCNRRTWNEFEAVCKEEVIRCEPERVILPDIEIRPRGQVNKASTKDQPPINLKGRCPKIRWPGCRRSRDKTLCVPPVSPKCCQKRCTQYPSFSECCRKKPSPKRKTECGCTDAVSPCQTFERARWLLEH